MKAQHVSTFDLTPLSERARRELKDFYQFLLLRYPRRQKATKTESASQSSLGMSDFVGIWKDREEMEDASAWVDRQRRTVWSRHE